MKEKNIGVENLENVTGGKRFYLKEEKKSGKTEEELKKKNEKSKLNLDEAVKDIFSHGLNIDGITETVQ